MHEGRIQEAWHGGCMYEKVLQVMGEELKGGKHPHKAQLYMHGT